MQYVKWAIVADTLLALCTPIAPSRPIWNDRFCSERLTMLANGEENPQNCPFPWDFVTLPEEDRATAISNMHRNIW